MKIDSSSKSIGSLPSAGGARADSAGAAKQENVPTAKTGGSSTVVAASLYTITDTAPAFNAEKVAEIRQAISEGRFQVNAERIADGLISSVREMLAQGRPSA
jgi:negative regulator of flagellin synthesis FlgM